jgi:hypothetical protein
MFIEALESRMLFSVVTLTANTTGVLTLKSGEILNGNGHKVGGLTGDDVSSVTIENLDVVGTRGSGISFYADKAGISGLTLNDVTVSGFTSGYGVLIGTVGKGTYSNISLNEITAFSNGDAGISTYGNTGSISNFSLTNSTAYNNPGIKGSNSPSGSGIMLGGLNDATVEYCVAYNNGAKNNANSGPVGIFAYDSNAVTISNCDSYNNKTQYHDGGGFDLDGGVTNSTIIDCISSGNVGYGFAAFTYAGSTANSGNYFLDNVSTGDGEGFEYWSNGPSITNLTVTGNQFLNPTSGYAVIGGTGSAYVNIVLSDNTYSPGALTWIGT